MTVDAKNLPILAYRGEIRPSDDPDGSKFEHFALLKIEPSQIRSELEDLIKAGNQNYYARVYRLALSKYLAAFNKCQEMGLGEDHPLVISIRVMLGDTHNALFRFEEAKEQFVKVSHQDLSNENTPISLHELWKKLAKSFLGSGDSFYKSAADEVASRQKEIRAEYDKILAGGITVNPSSALYSESLAAMQNTVRRIVKAIDGASEDLSDIDAEIVALIYDCRIRFEQINAGLNFLGHGANYVPTLRFKHLKNVARSFAITAAQANREYLSYVTKIQDETFTLRQLEQAVEVNRSGVAIHQAAEDAAKEEAEAADAAVDLANLRKRQAEAYRNKFSRDGYEIALLDEALSWAQANSTHHKEQIKLRYDGLTSLGIAERYQPQSHLIQELTWQRARRNFDLQLERLNHQANELRASEKVAREQHQAAVARSKTAGQRRRAAEERLRHAENNLELVRSRAFGVEFFSEAAHLVRETAAIYLQNAMLVAHAMELAYSFETGRNLRRIRLDYGDLDGAAGVFAADLLMRDIDAFTLDEIASAEVKTQPAIRRISLTRDYPLEFLYFRKFGRMRFSTLLNDFQRLHPGLYEGRIKSVIVRPVGLTGANGAIGTLTANGVSWARRKDGARYEKMHATETLILSAFDTRRDRIFTPLPEEQLDIFENIGLETDWELEIPQSRNEFDVGQLIDVELFISFYGKFDRSLERMDLAKIPPREKAEIRFSLLRDFGGDAKYKLSRGQQIVAEIVSALLPRQHEDPIVKELRLLAIENEGKVVPLTVRFWSKTDGSSEDSYTANSKGVISITNEDNIAPPQGRVHLDKDLLNSWCLEVRAEENPDLSTGNPDIPVDLHNINDLFLVVVYEHANPIAPSTPLLMVRED